MRIAITGTPGTGKTTVASLLPMRVIDVNALVKEGLHFGTDPNRGCLEADMEGLPKKIDEIDPGREAVLEGHLSHHLADHAIVLRLHPRDLRERLLARGYSEEKVRENLEAEALDVILVEAVEGCSRVDEIDTTGRTPEEVAALVLDIIEGKISHPPGEVSWLEEFFD